MAEIVNYAVYWKKEYLKVSQSILNLIWNSANRTRTANGNGQMVSAVLLPDAINISTIAKLSHNVLRLLKRTMAEDAKKPTKRPRVEAVCVICYSQPPIYGYIPCKHII